MTADTTTFAMRPPEACDLARAADPLQTAREHVMRTAIRASDPHRRLTGLELEFHLVDLHAPARRPSWPEVQALLSTLAPMPSGSSVTVEPGGQLELSTPPTHGIAASVAALRADRRVLGDAAAAAGFGLASLGTDPARTPRRVNPSARYVAMEEHFAAMGCLDAGRAMMTATAALQVNVDAGPPERWGERVAHLDLLGPVLVAMSACSPILAGSTSGWRSHRQQAWSGIDPRRTGSTSTARGNDPAEAWADYALAAPVMLVAGTDGTGGTARESRAVTTGASFADWLAGRGSFSRPPTGEDLDYHLTTLFPPVRPRGYLELRYLDAQPERWWPALAAIVSALVDDPVAADAAAEHCEPIRGRWQRAAEKGLDDPAIHAAALGCIDAASRNCAVELKAEVEAYADLVAGGRTPGDELADRARATTPLTVLEEEARAY